MFPNWTGWKAVKAVLFVLSGLVPAVVPAQYQALASAIVGALGTIVVVLSGTSMGPTMAKVAGAALLLVAVGTSVVACSGCSGQPLPPAVVEGGNFGLCVIEQYALDPVCRPAAHNPIQCSLDIADKCVGNHDAPAVAQVNQHLAAHKAAMVADGFVVPAGDAGP